MSTLSLSSPPPGITEDVWATHEAAEPEAGDLWLLSWDGRALGLCVIYARLDDFVLVWPVSLPSDPVAPPAVTVTNTPLEVPLYPWPSRETGVSDMLLHRRLGRLIDTRTLEATAEAFDDGDPPPLPFAPVAATADRVAAEGYSLELIDIWASICLLEWPGPAPDRRLDPDALRKAHVSPSALAEILNSDTPTAVQVFRGEASVTPSQFEAIESATGVSPGQLVGGNARKVQRLLIDPSRKPRILELSEHLGIGEADARDLVASEYALAARSTGGVEERLEGVFSRLLADR
ncbi:MULTISPECIES: hypothetical protein [Oerskovia]|uniref:HTH cro/C1-type domain-containing protein n=1 Tax=Oerskovia enterophila TaxID=43678 RepID=A0A163QI82_9CELL|nr:MULTISPECIES: hypothetical protein [Oerskovia]KRC39996.1 hypothetical protein ASE15_19400 [Oerskovia sp. Root22]KZM34191.1 hypothetical protein OJAG_30200 [Oerskovia enterophila]